MNSQEYAVQAEAMRTRLYKTALLYLNSPSMALDAVDEAVYKGLCSCKKLRQPEHFGTWITRILINECHNELRRHKRLCPLEALPETAAEQFDALPLREAIARLPRELKELVILRYFSGFTLTETAQLLQIPQGTAATRQRRALQLLRMDLGEEERS